MLFLLMVPQYFLRRSLIDICFQADLLLQFGFGDDLKALTPVIPRRCQCLLMSATSRCVICVSFLFILNWVMTFVVNHFHCHPLIIFGFDDYMFVTITGHIKYKSVF